MQNYPACKELNEITRTKKITYNNAYFVNHITKIFSSNIIAFECLLDTRMIKNVFNLKGPFTQIGALLHIQIGMPFG